MESGDERVVLFVSNNFRMKGLTYLLKALGKIKKGEPPSFQTSCPAARDRKVPIYTGAAKEMGILERGDFVGSTSEPEKYYGHQTSSFIPPFTMPVHSPCWKALATGLPSDPHRIRMGQVPYHGWARGFCHLGPAMIRYW